MVNFSAVNFSSAVARAASAAGAAGSAGAAGRVLEGSAFSQAVGGPRRRSQRCAGGVEPSAASARFISDTYDSQRKGVSLSGYLQTYPFSFQISQQVFWKCPGNVYKINCLPAMS